MVWEQLFVLAMSDSGTGLDGRQLHLIVRYGRYVIEMAVLRSRTARSAGRQTTTTCSMPLSVANRLSPTCVRVTGWLDYGQCWSAAVLSVRDMGYRLMAP